LTLLVVSLVIVGVNLLPAFAPPTWAVLVIARSRYGLDLPALVVVGAAAATCGRGLLAVGARRARRFVSPERIASLSAAHDLLVSRRSAMAGLFALFLVSPLPSGQLFLAAGFLAMRLWPLLLAFFLGRLVTYTLYVSAADVAGRTVRGLIGQGVGSPVAIGLQVGTLVVLVVLARVDWVRVAHRLRARSGDVEDDSLGER
jgi:membrane protein YqaA with SNARE-associated domain